MPIQSKDKEAINKLNTRKGKLRLIAEFTKMLENHDFDELEYKIERGCQELPKSSRSNIRHKPNHWFSVNAEAVMVKRVSRGKRSLKLSTR